MFRRSRAFGDLGGGGGFSLLAEVPLDNHENPIPSFLNGGAGEGAEAAFGAIGGGGPQGTVGRFPERPCDRKGSLGGEEASLVSGLFVVAPDSMELASIPFSSCTSAIEEVEIR